MKQKRAKERKYQLQAACCSDRGIIRGNNEDNIYFDRKYLEAESSGTDGILRASYNVPLKSDDGGILFAVFDGIGGSQCGEYASFIAAHTADAFCSMILDAVAGEYNAVDMGTTAVSLFFYAGRAWCSNVGDSRCYLLRGDELYRISTDHTTEEALNALGFRGIKPQLTQCVGMDPDNTRIIVSQKDFPFARGDVFLLCSDGLTDMAADEEIAAVLGESENPASALVELALKNGGRDNVTCIVIENAEKQD